MRFEGWDSFIDTHLNDDSRSTESVLDNDFLSQVAEERKLLSRSDEYLIIFSCLFLIVELAYRA